MGTGISTLTITVQFSVNSISPSSGSIFGGTQLTIIGTGFPQGYAQILSVNIGGKAWCNVVSMTATEVICNIEQGAYQGVNLSVLVMLRIQLQAVLCATCYFTFDSNLVPKITQN